MFRYPVLKALLTPLLLFLFIVAVCRTLGMEGFGNHPTSVLIATAFGVGAALRVRSLARHRRSG